ncbi:MAG: excinuclease ABC subunit UvrC [Christensenella hongkongensis]|uniref:excinuclease ABC subunit UvrC n=1 Tax=Christensenella hongkongensis TaxID=270498 RepID=UPI00267210EC|nr:excinuclease ABC subunit UvrC [Christensenella hongkongensis]MDY3005016.1 excinuclease ABC subunit UvrC [Christensenella hongkongensis]
MELSEKLKKRIKNLPQTPGVYIMRDKDGKVIYVGKALVLKNRVSSYFRKEAQKYAKVAAMVSHIDDFEYIITDTELEALILECNLIKKYRPYYNIMLKDDKHFPYVRVDLNEPFPRVTVVRSVKDDGAKYYGPFIAAHVIRDVLDQVYRLYPLRSCNNDIPRMIARGERPCLNYEMGRCIGPCTGKVSKEEYDELVKEVIGVVSGSNSKIRKELVRKMNEASENMNFEQAALMRDRIALIDRIREKQRAGFPNLDDKDVFAVEKGLKTAVVQAFLFRDGKLLYAQKYYFDYDGEPLSEIMGQFIQQYYAEKSGIPKHIYVLPRPDGSDLLMEWLSEKRGSRVEIREAVRGDNRKLVELARKNASDAIKIKEGMQAQREAAAGNLAKALGIDAELKRIECYDISNTQGTNNVASMVVFTDGKPDRKKYRQFKIKGFEGANDFASLNETLERRLVRGLRGDESFLPMPDLIIIDGGKGQLHAARDALFSLGCEDIPIVSLAKKQEEIFVPGKEESILLKVGSPEFRLVTGIRDEAHRFAITFHRKLREKRHHTGELDQIEGIGDTRKRTLLKFFGSVKRVREASLEELKTVKGLPDHVAEKVYEHFHGDSAS